MVAAALLALAAAVVLLVASLFRADGLVLVWCSLAVDALAAALLVAGLRRRRPGGPAGP